MKSDVSDYQTYLEPEMCSSARATAILGSLLCIIFLAADAYALSLPLSEMIVIRGVVVLSSLSLFFVSFAYQELFIRYYNPIIFSISLIAASSIILMIHLASPTDHAATVYFVGLIIVIMLMFAWLFMRTEVALSGVTIIISSYAYVAHINGLATTDLFVNILFLCSGAATGIFTQIFRNRHLRQNFLLTQSLKELLEVKTEEAGDYAHQANHDELTALPNRRYIIKKLEKNLQIAKQADKVLLILFIDLNGFKLINDTYGHASGDAVLVKIARRLEQTIIKGDCLSRLGGDEYLVGLMLDKGGLIEAEEIVNKFTAIVSYPMNIEGKKLKVGASIGVAAYPEHGDTVEQLVDFADKKMYQAKNGETTVESAEQLGGESNIISFPYTKNA